MKGVRITHLTSVLFQGFEAIMNVWIFLQLKYFIDNVLGDPDKVDSAIFIAVSILAHAILQALFYFLSKYLSVHRLKSGPGDSV
mgnify:CR=1 FL=1